MNGDRDMTWISMGRRTEAKGRRCTKPTEAKGRRCTKPTGTVGEDLGQRPKVYEAHWNSGRELRDSARPAPFLYPEQGE